jgi:hypothetical protein
MGIWSLNPSRHHPAFLFEFREIALGTQFFYRMLGFGGEAVRVLGRHSDAFISCRPLVKLA